MNNLRRGLTRVLTSTFIGFAIFVVFGTREAQGRPLSFAEFGSQVSLPSAVISPDGKQIAVVTARNNYNDNRFDQSLILVDIASGAQRVLSSPSMFSVGSPQWSPRGDRLAWLGSGEGEQPQIHVISMLESGAHPVRVTNVANGVRTNRLDSQSYAWSSDGKSIAYVTADSLPERPGVEQHNKSFEVIDNDYLATEAPPSFHLWLVSVVGGEPKRLTSGVESVAGIGWIRNGESIAFMSQPRPHNSPTGYAEFLHRSSVTTVLKAINIGDGSERFIAPAPVRPSSPPVSSPDGELIAFRQLYRTEPHNAAVVPSIGGEVRVLTKDLDRDIEGLAWLPGSDALLVTGPDSTRSGLWLQLLNGPSRRLDLGPVVELSGDPSVSDHGAIAFVGVESRRAPEVYVMTSVDAKPRPLTQFNEHLEKYELGHVGTIRWRFDGFDQTGVLIYPPQFKKGQKIPLVLNIHGGPRYTSTEAFVIRDHILAGQGWAVFKPNYRGSNSQGTAFQSAIINDLGAGPGRDIMAGIAAVKALGFVDEDRIAVSGWSYGGFMTAWLIGNYQGWAAAVAGAPLTNLLDWYSLSCCNAWADYAISGSPWVNGNVANFLRQSPISYAHKVTTPTLVLQNMWDANVPYTGVYSFYHALRDNGVPVKFIIYPILGHTANIDPIHQRDVLRRWIDWIDEHFRRAKTSSN